MVDKSEKFRWLVRLGFAARGVVYLLLGYIALGTGGEAKGGQAAVFDYIQQVPFGTPLLWIMALGLLGYAVFKFLSAVADIQHQGSDATGALQRVGDAASGVAHTFFAYVCYQFAKGAQQSVSDGSGGQEMAGSVLAMELGSVLIGLLGLGFLVAGFMEGKKAWTAGFMRWISHRAPSGVRTAGRIGHAARGIVFAVIGWSMVQGAWFARESEIKGLGEAILSLRGMGTLYTLVAVGLMVFGAFGLVLSRYRIVPDLGPNRLRPSFRT